MKKVAFVCVHNSCRSQIAEALGKKLASDVFESYSAGTETKPRINQDAVRLLKQTHGIDMEQTQRSKLLSDIPAVDVVVTMGCNVQCPFLPCSHWEDWGLEDPTGKPDEAFLETIRAIEEKVLDLRKRLKGVTEVVAALIWDGDRFLICQRPAHKARGLLWEFAGGKVEPGETKEQALIRECREELAVTLRVGETFMEVLHEYPDITVRLTLFHATIHSGEPRLLEHNAIAWIDPSEIPQYEFCPADKEILERIMAEK